MPIHSRLGLISLCGGGAVIVINLVIIIIYISAAKDTPLRSTAGSVLLGFSLIASPLLHITGLVLGVVGCFKRGAANLTLSILGILLNTLIAFVFWVTAILLVTPGVK